MPQRAPARSSRARQSSRQRSSRVNRPAAIVRTLEPITPHALVTAHRRLPRIALAISADAVLIGIILLIAHSQLPFGVVAGGLVLIVTGLSMLVGGFFLGSPKRLLATLPSGATEHEGLAEFVNLLEGLCAVNGLSIPTLRLLDDPALNALTIGWRGDDATLVVTTGMLEACDRMELEGIIARELAQVKRGDLRDAAFAGVACGLFGFVAGVGRLVGRMLSPTHQSGCDLGGVAITRYPPGLTRALLRCSECANTRPASLPRRFARLTAASWLVPLEEGEPVKPRQGELNLEERIGLLAEL